MYEELNYAELEEWRDSLLISMVGVSHDDPNFEVNRKWIEAISTEVERREDIARKRILSAAIAVNILVLALILFVAGCQTVKGVTGDAGWILTELSDNITVQEK